MMKYRFTLIISELIFHLVNAQLSRIGEKFVKEGFTPLMVENPPHKMAVVRFANHVKVKGGTIMTYDEVKDKPEIHYFGKIGKFYAICLAKVILPDENNTQYKEYDHWIVGNIPGSSIQKGEIILPYNITPPQKDYELHPYVLTVFHQEDRTNFINEIYNDTIKNVPGIVRLKDLVSKYDLTGPMAGNYFFL